MSTTTISLDRSAYDLLRAQKRSDESFSDEIHRLLGPHKPELREFLTLLSSKDAARVADCIETSRAEDLAFERRKYGRRVTKNGHRA